MSIRVPFLLGTDLWFDAGIGCKVRNLHTKKSPEPRAIGSGP